MSAGSCASDPTFLCRQWRHARRTAAAVAIGLALGGAARAQTPAPPSTTQTPAPPPVVAGWNEGFFIQTPNGDNRLQIGFVLQADGRFSIDDPLPITNTFVMRKVRPTFTGRVGKFFDFKVMPELAGSVVLLDGYFDIRFSPKLRLRSGKDKTPVGYELLIGDAFLIFPERSVVSLLVPNRDVGFQAQGDLAGGRLTYAGGIFNGNPADGTSAITDVDTNNRKDLAGRIVWMPFRSTKTPPHALNNFGVHLGGSTGRQIGALPSVQNIGRPNLLLVPHDDHRRRPAKSDHAGRLPLSQELRRVRGVRALDAGDRVERCAANGHQSGVGRHGLIRADG